MHKCNEFYIDKIDEVDYVECKVCGFRSKRISIHIKKHGMDINEYKSKFGKVICSESSKRYSENNFQWLLYAKANGIDLTKYRNKMSISVSKSILSNDKERKRRAKLMQKMSKEFWKDPEYREKISNVSKETSSRPDIIQQRSIQLQKWRDENPEDFYNKCTRNMHESWKSKPESILFEILKEQSEFSFKRNQFVKSKIFDWKSQRKQVDIADKSKRIYVEFDGIFHFQPIFGNDRLYEVQRRDKLLEEYISLHKWTLVRISYDQFKYTGGGNFEEECLKQLFSIIQSHQKGIFKIGNLYG